MAATAKEIKSESTSRQETAVRTSLRTKTLTQRFLIDFGLVRGGARNC